MPRFAYSTDHPEVVAAFRETRAAMQAYLPQLADDIANLDGAKGPLVRAGIWGSRDKLAALEPDGSGNIPDGWRIVRGRLEPRRGKPGGPARKWLQEHQPPDVRHTMMGHGLPRYAAIATNTGGYRMVPPVLFEYDGSLWACYDGEPGKGFLQDGGPCTWTPRKLSEFHAAREAVETVAAGLNAASGAV